MVKEEEDRRDYVGGKLAEMKQMMNESEMDVKETNEMLGKRDKLHKRRKDIIEQVKEASNPKQKSLAKKAVTTKMRNQRVNQKIQEESARMSKYERAFKQILDATGISDISEVIKKYMEQEDLEKVGWWVLSCFGGIGNNVIPAQYSDTFPIPIFSTQNLETTIGEYDTKLTYLEDQKFKTEQQLEEIRFSGLGNIGKTRKLLDEMEEKMTAQAKEVRVSKDNFERISATTSKVQQGVVHLAARLDEVNLDSKDIDPHEVREENLAQVLWECCQKIEKMSTAFPLSSVNLEKALDSMLKERESMKSPTKMGNLKEDFDQEPISDWNEAVGDDTTNDAAVEGEMTRAQIKETEIQMRQLEARCRRRLERRVREEKNYELDAGCNEFIPHKFLSALQEEIRKDLERVRAGMPLEGLGTTQRTLIMTAPEAAPVAEPETQKKEVKKKKDANAKRKTKKQRGRASINQ